MHVGLGTFQSVSVEDLNEASYGFLSIIRSPRVRLKTVNRALDSDVNKVTICGTTVVRAVETSLTVSRHLKPQEGRTDKFIYPPYEFAVTERLITNFSYAQEYLDDAHSCLHGI